MMMTDKAIDVRKREINELNHMLNALNDFVYYASNNDVFCKDAFSCKLASCELYVNDSCLLNTIENLAEGFNKNIMVKKTQAIEKVMQKEIDI